MKKIKIIILLFSHDTFNWLKVTVKTFKMSHLKCHIIFLFQINAVLLNLIFIKQT